jgi:hypothetical protein
MAKLIVCDICGKPTQVRAKMFLADLALRGNGSIHGNYNFHLDVGECCYQRVRKAFKWHKRLSSEEYHESRRQQSTRV